MNTAHITVEESTRYLTALGYRVSAPLYAEVATAANMEGSGRSLCEGFTGSYSLGLHIGAMFLILFVSLLGTAIPILGKWIPWLVKFPFVFSVAKSAATGVLLSVSTIHLIYEGAEGFSEECIPASLKTYGPLYFLFALVGVLLMQALDMQLADIAERWMKAKLKAEAEDTNTDNKDDKACRGLSPAVEVGVASGPAQSDEALIDELEGVSAEGNAKATVLVASLKDCEAPLSPKHQHHSDEAAAHGHQHLSVAPPPDMGSITRVISAVCMEFGVTLHSVFVGLTVGLTTDSELKPLIVALVFHQLFEGMAMGSRLADAKFRTILDIVLALVFAISAPAGMAAAAIAVSVSPAAMSGSGFVTLIAVLDTLCGGILLYLAFTLLLGDFVADVRHYCADGQRYRIAKKITLFVALWVGMGLMALVGNWL
ncbi:iron/zinc transporter protein-like protein [Leishmania panamensis]|uniref:Iron/zinc transporter protein-like protein n=1 Tax=Leishmania panamensis TaxID=5679 RepID=A0A088RY50_LEIPA